MISQKRLQHLLEYNPETGVFIWKHPNKSNARLVGMAAGTTCSNGYRKIWADGHQHYAHRLVWIYVYGELEGKYIDHINGEPSDNRIVNLRLASLSQNQANRRLGKDNRSGLKGASFNKRDKAWISQIRVNGKHVYLGSFNTAEKAHDIYVEAARKYYKEFARWA